MEEIEGQLLGIDHKYSNTLDLLYNIHLQFLCHACQSPTSSKALFTSSKCMFGYYDPANLS